MDLTLTEIEVDVLCSLLDDKLAENRRHSGPDAKPHLRTRILQEIRGRLGPPKVTRPYKSRPSPIFKVPSL